MANISHVSKKDDKSQVKTQQYVLMKRNLYCYLSNSKASLILSWFAYLAYLSVVVTEL